MGGLALAVTTKSKEDEEILTKSLGERGGLAGRAGFQNGNLARMTQFQRIAQAPPQRITVVDRQGLPIATLGEPGLFAYQAFSPDGTRVAAVLTNRESGASDVWVYDASGGKALTSDEEADATPVWSPDGRQIAYVRADGDSNGIYRRAADGSGPAELVYKHNTGGSLFLTDWSNADLLCFWTSDSQTLYILPLKGERKPIPLFEGRGGRISPDGRYIVYSSNGGGGPMISYVRPLNLSGAATKPVQVHKDPALGGVVWRADGKGFSFTSLAGLQISGLWQVEITETPELAVSEPKLVFKPTGLASPAQLSSIATRDLERFVTLPAVR
jgi:Tol biopolymer transport system component